MKKYSVVLFDLDGTLLDTLEDLADAVNVALGMHGLPCRTREEVRAFIGNGIVKLMERAVGAEQARLVDMAQVVDDFREYYFAHCEDKTAPYEGVIDVLTDLRAQGVRVGVVSNKADFAVQKLCRAYFGDLVEVAIGENEAEGRRKKPAPDTLIDAMRSFGAAAEDVVYVGDSEVDILTAKNANVACVSVTWGMKDKAFLLENGATILVGKVTDLLSVL